MAVSLRFIPGSTIRWQERRFVVVDYVGMDAIVAREVGKRRLQRIPVNQAITDLTPGDRDAWTPDLVSVPEEAWQTAVRRFKILRPLFEIGHTERPRAINPDVPVFKRLRARGLRRCYARQPRREREG
jgi:hypothetical protein